LTGRSDQDRDFDLFQEMKGYDIPRLHAELTSPDMWRRYAAARQLHFKGGEDTFAYALALLKAAEAERRDIGAFVLGQLGTSQRPFLARSIGPLRDLVVHDADADVRASAAAALGHLRSPAALDALLAAAADPEAEVRANVAFALGATPGDGAIDGLLRLTHDAVPLVVEWTLLGLQGVAPESPRIRDRLAQMLEAAGGAPPVELIQGLAERQDARVLPALLAALDEDDIDVRLIEAAGALGDRRALPPLLALRAACGVDAPKALLDAIDKLRR
jgi:HEAT repeat protein